MAARPSGREAEKPYFGWLATESSLYSPSTLNPRRKPAPARSAGVPSSSWSPPTTPSPSNSTPASLRTACAKTRKPSCTPTTTRSDPPQTRTTDARPPSKTPHNTCAKITQTVGHQLPNLIEFQFSQAPSRGLGCPISQRAIGHVSDAALAMQHTLRAIDGEDETIAELEMIVGFDDDLAGEATRAANRLHGLPTQITHRADTATNEGPQTA